MSDLVLLSLATLDLRQPAVLRGLVAAVLLFLALFLLLPSGIRHSRARRSLAALCGVVGLMLLWWTVPWVGTLTEESGFAVLAALAIGSAAATIASRSPVYCAIWFAVSLLGTAALLLLQGAQFLSIATVAVYAGAIVVTFLFVLMLAQPEGHTFYDRVSWGTAPRLLASLTAVVLTMLLSAAVTRPSSSALTWRSTSVAAVQGVLNERLPQVKVRGLRRELWQGEGRVRVTVAVPADQQAVFAAEAADLARLALTQLPPTEDGAMPRQLVFESQDVAAAEHTAHLGGQLFSRHLATIQGAGALLLAALVGAVAIAARSPADEAPEQGLMP